MVQGREVKDRDHATGVELQGQDHGVEDLGLGHGLEHSHLHADLGLANRADHPLAPCLEHRGPSDR